MTIAALVPLRAEPAPQPVEDDFTDLYRQYRPQLLRYVTHHFGPRDADEIAQEALTRALRSLDRNRSEAETWAWLVRVARNVAHDLARARRICDATDDDTVLASDAHDDTVLPEPAALLDEKRRLVRSALKMLPPSQRRILVLYEVDELNCPAIARLVGSTEDAVRKALQRARRRFAAEVRALGGGTCGSVAWWLRGLRRRSLKAMPAASASTAIVALVGTVAITVSGGQPAPHRELTPELTSPVAASAPEAERPAARPAVRRSAPVRADRTAVRPTTVQVAPPKGDADKDTGMIKLTPPKTPLHQEQNLRVEIVKTPWTTVYYEFEHGAPSEGQTVLCGTALVDCETE